MGLEAPSSLTVLGHDHLLEQNVVRSPVRPRHHVEVGDGGAVADWPGRGAGRRRNRVPPQGREARRVKRDVREHGGEAA